MFSMLRSTGFGQSLVKTVTQHISPRSRSKAVLAGCEKSLAEPLECHRQKVRPVTFQVVPPLTHDFYEV